MKELVTQKATGSVLFRFFGDEDAAKNYAGIARGLLGQMKGYMQLAGITGYQNETRLQNGVVIRTQSNTNGLAAIDEVWISVPKLPKEKKMLEILVLGYIIFSKDDFLIITPSHKEVGYAAHDSNGQLIDFNVYDVEYVGYPDNGVKLSTLTNSPEYQMVLVNDYTEGASWDIYDTCANIPPPAPTSQQFYTTGFVNTDLSLFIKRTDNNGFWGGAYFRKDEDGNFIITENTAMPFYTVAFMIPMSAKARKMRYDDYIIPLNTWDYSYDTYVIDLVRGNNYPFKNPESDHDPIEGCSFEWQIWTEHIYDKGDMPAHAWGLDNNVEWGTHRVIAGSDNVINYTIWLYTDQGIFKRDFIDEAHAVPGDALFNIEVGPVDNIDAAVRLIKP